MMKTVRRFPDSYESLRRFVKLLAQITPEDVFCRLFQDDRKRSLEGLLRLIDGAEGSMPYAEFIANWAVELLKGVDTEVVLEIKDAALKGEDLTPFYDMLIVHGVQAVLIPVFLFESPTILWVSPNREMTADDHIQALIVRKILNRMPEIFTNLILNIDDIPEDDGGIESWLREVIHQGGISASLFPFFPEEFLPEMLLTITLHKEIRDMIARIAA